MNNPNDLIIYCESTCDELSLWWNIIGGEIPRNKIAKHDDMYEVCMYKTHSTRKKNKSKSNNGAIERENKTMVYIRF